MTDTQTLMRSPDTAALIDLESRYGARNYKPLDVVLTRGEGVYVWDVEGRRYLDCLSAYSAVNQGHCHPKILAAMVAQAALLDSARGCAVHSKLRPDQGFTTLELKVAYHKAMTDKTGRVRAEGRLVSLGRRAGFAREPRTIIGSTWPYARLRSNMLLDCSELFPIPNQSTV